MATHLLSDLRVRRRDPDYYRLEAAIKSLRRLCRMGLE